MIDVLIKRNDTQTQRRQTHREEGHVKMRQRLELCCHEPRNARSHQKLEESRKNLPLEPLKRAPGTLILDFWPPEL